LANYKAVMGAVRRLTDPAPDGLGMSARGITVSTVGLVPRMRQLAEEGRTMIVVTHEMGFAREVASEVIFLHQGRIEEQGPPADVFGNPRSERMRQFLGGAR
jgi:ABC-type histidine transport system ATPase subunit